MKGVKIRASTRGQFSDDADTEARIMPSRWLLHLVKRLAVGWIFGII